MNAMRGLRRFILENTRRTGCRTAETTAIATAHIQHKNAIAKCEYELGCSTPIRKKTRPARCDLRTVPVL